MIEKRRHPRFPFGQHLQLRTEHPAGRIVVDAKDVSESGLSFTTEQKLSVGDVIVLGLKEDDLFLIEARVRNVRKQGDYYVVGAERTPRSRWR
jgi:hypothetical protein